MDTQRSTKDRLSRVSHEARGLKSFDEIAAEINKMSRLSRGAWIKITLSLNASAPRASRLSRGAWIKISIRRHRNQTRFVSRLSRGAWIKIFF